MPVRRPDPANLPASREWVREKFAIKSQYRAALQQTNMSLSAIDAYAHSFLLAKAGLLACLERWQELVVLLEDLLVRYPNDPEVHTEAADVFMAHGDWETCFLIHQRAHKLIRLDRDRKMLELYYHSRLESLYAVGRSDQAVKEGKRILARYPRFGMLRALLKHIAQDLVKIEPWAPRGAAYLKGLRRLAT